MLKRFFSKLSFAGKLATHNLVRVEAESFLIATRKLPCGKCQNNTNAQAFIVTSASKNFEQCGLPTVPSYMAVLSYIEDLSSEAAAYLKENVPSYFLDDSPQWRPRPYWTNHCEYCHTKMSDFGIIESTIAPLRPTVIDSDEVSLTIINKSLRAKAILHRRGLKGADPGFLASLMIDTNQTRHDG